MAEVTPLTHGEVVGYIVLLWSSGMGWQDNWDGEVHATYEDALRSADESGDPEHTIVTECRYVATADPANWHAAKTATDNPAELCQVCGVRQDRAVHDKTMAAQHGVMF